MVPDPRVYPSEIGPSDDERNLRVVWGDGVVSEYDPRSLRILCPCAGCVDEMTGERTLKAETGREVYTRRPSTMSVSMRFSSYGAMGIRQVYIRSSTCAKSGIARFTRPR